MSIEDKRDQLVEELIPFEDHLERLTYVIMLLTLFISIQYIIKNG